MSRPTGGFVKLHRKILNSWVSDDPVAAWMLCLLVMWANRSPGQAMLHRSLIRLERGQVATGRDELARKLRCSKNKVDRLISQMQAGSILGSKRTNAGTIITILNYDEYQIVSEDDWAANRAANPDATGAAAGAAAGAHREKREERRENSFYAKNARAPRRAKTERGISPSALAKATTSRAVAILRSQLRDGVDPRTSDAAAAAMSELGTDSRDLLLKKYPTWSDFAVTWVDQHERGYCQAFERELKADLGAIAKVGSSRQQDAT